MKERAHGVAIVVEEAFADRLAALAARLHVWVIDTPANKAAAIAIPSNGPAVPSLEFGVTTFVADRRENPDEIVASILGTVDLHHGEYSHSPPWSFVEVYGAAPTAVLLTELAALGFTDVGPMTEGGFKARRPGGAQ